MTSPTPTLTQNPLVGTYGFTCTEHGVHRFGLTERHARNVEAKHLREHHDPMAHLAASLTLDLTAAAVYAAAAYAAEGHGQRDLAGQATLDMWEALVGLDRDQAEALALWLLGADPHYTAAVVPV